MTELEFLRNRVSTLDSTLETAVSELRAMLDRSNAHLKPALRHSNDAERRIREARGHLWKVLVVASPIRDERGRVPMPIFNAVQWLENDEAATT